MLRIILFFSLLSAAYVSYGQQTFIVNDKIAPDITAQYHVLKDSPDVKQGRYLALYKKKIVAAMGNYERGKQTSIWHFYDPSGKIVQHYNFSTKQLIYEVPDDTLSYKISYDFDKKIADTDRVTKPIRIGDIFYGYQPYLKLFKIDASTLNRQPLLYVVLQVLVSPNGRLAECKLVVRARLNNNIVDSYLINNESLTDDDKLFIPATINHENVSSTIYILCKLTPNGGVSIY